VCFPSRVMHAIMKPRSGRQRILSVILAACLRADPQKGILAQPLAHDARIRAAVVADPLGGFLFTAQSLAAVKVPVQLWSERGGAAGLAWQSYGTAVRKGSPAGRCILAGWHQRPVVSK
jgi:hypothetical protein